VEVGSFAKFIWYEEEINKKDICVCEKLLYIVQSVGLEAVIGP